MGANPMGSNPMGVAGYPGVGIPSGLIPGAQARRPGGPEPGSFRALAETAMKAGKEKEALQFLCAHYAVHGGDDLAEKMNWVDGLKRPTMAVRVGIGIVFSAPGDFRGDPQPVGHMPAPSTAAGGGGEKKPVQRKRFGYRDQNQQQPAQPSGQAATVPVDAQGTLVFFTGELGEALLDRLDEREGPDGIGVVLKQLLEKPAAAGGQGSGNPAMPMGAGMAPMNPPVQMPMGGGTSDKAASLAEREPQSLGPGITLLGVQPDEKQLKKRAKEQGVDVLILFDVEVRPAKVGNIVNNTTKMVLYSMTQENAIVTTREINNQKVADDRAKSREIDVVENELNRLFEAFDKQYKMKELPSAITAERARARIQGLAKQLPDNPAALPLLAEMRFYQAKGLVSSVDVVMALQDALGEETVSKLLAAEKDEDKIDQFSAWFPRSEADEKGKEGKGKRSKG